MKLNDAMQVMAKLCNYSFNKAYRADAAWKVIKAAIASQPAEQPRGEPVAWMLRDSDGNVHWDEVCIFSTEGGATEEAACLQDDGGEELFAFPLYADPIAQPKPEQAMGDEVRRFNHEYNPNRAYNQSLMMPAVDGQYIEASEVDGLVHAMKLALEYWEHRQMRYKNRAPVWVTEARKALEGIGT
jgi:hypothetical protein